VTDDVADDSALASEQVAANWHIVTAQLGPCFAATYRKSVVRYLKFRQLSSFARRFAERSSSDRRW
jgi:hypothetical protein